MTTMTVSTLRESKMFGTRQFLAKLGEYRRDTKCSGSLAVALLEEGREDAMDLVNQPNPII